MEQSTPVKIVKKRRLVRDFLIIAISVVVAIYIQVSQISDILLSFFSDIPYAAAFFTGFLFSLTFTTAIATSVFILLSETNQTPFLIALFGGLGSVAGNVIIYKFFKEEILEDIRYLEPKYAQEIAHKIFHSKLFIGLVPYLAALLLISPLPDEIGILMLAGSNYRYTHFFLFSFGLHSLGILLIVLLGETIT